MTNAPNPGSEEAIKQGCTCPVLDNNHGKGAETIHGTCFWFNGECRIHGLNTEDEKDD